MDTKDTFKPQPELSSLIASLEDSDTIENHTNKLLGMKCITNRDKLLVFGYFRSIFDPIDEYLPTPVFHFCLLYAFLTIKISVKDIKANHLPKYIAEVKSSNSAQQNHGTLCIRVLLSKHYQDKLCVEKKIWLGVTGQKNESIHKEVIDSGITPIFISILNGDYDNKIKFEACWCLTNLCSAATTNDVCNTNTLKAFEHVLKTEKNLEIFEQSVWGIGNVVATSQEFRNIIINDGMFQFLLEKAEQFFKTKNYVLTRNVMWCLSNLVRYDGVGNTTKWKELNSKARKPTDLCSWNKIKNTIPIFTHILNEIGGKIKKLKMTINSGHLQPTDPEYNQCLQCCADCLWTIKYSQSYMELEPDSTYMSDIFCSNLVDIIILMSQMGSVSLLSPSIAIVGFFCSRDDYVTEKVLKKDYLRAATINLNCKVRRIRKEVCWTLSNIAGCERRIAIQIIEYENGLLLKAIINACLFDDDQVKKEAGYILANLITLNDPNIIHMLVKKGVIGAFRMVMKRGSLKNPLITIMEAFDTLMSHTQARDGGEYDYISKVEESGCCEIFDILQAGVDDTDKVFTTAYELLHKYWSDDGQLWMPPNINVHQDVKQDDINNDVKAQVLDGLTMGNDTKRNVDERDESMLGTNDNTCLQEPSLKRQRTQ